MIGFFGKRSQKKEPTELMKMIKANINHNNPALILVRHDGAFRGYNLKNQIDHGLSEVPFYSDAHPGKVIIRKWLEDLGFRNIQGYKFITAEKELIETFIEDD